MKFQIIIATSVIMILKQIFVETKEKAKQHSCVDC